MADYKLRLLTSLQDSDYFKINDTDGIPFGLFKTNIFPGGLQTTSALSSTAQVVKDNLGNSSALFLNKVNVDNPNGFIRIETPYAANTSGVFLAVNGNVIGDFRSDATNGFAMVSQGAYPISFYTQNTAVKALTISSAGLLQLGGTTNLFPAIKRNGAAIDFRLADDSNYASISMWNLNCSGIIYYGGNGESIASSGNSGWTDFRSNQGWQFTNAGGSSVYQRFTSAGISFGDSTLVASAQVTINSTTKGFLMPRMRGASAEAIASPADGLLIYCNNGDGTTINSIGWWGFQAGIWNKIF